MKVHVRYFARVAEITDRDGERVELPAGATAGAALDEVARRYTELQAPGFEPLLAVNRRHVQRDEPLADGDELAIFPPVSGG